MKKLLCVLLALTMLLAFCGCENKAALAVEEQINALGQITLESGDAITAAEVAFNSLDPKDRLEVRNSAALAAAMVTYENLQEKEQADIIDQLIRDLRPITVNSAKALTNAENLYNSADIEVKLKVKNFPEMVDAFQLYRFLCIDQVEVKITAIGEVTLESGDKIRIAQNAYDALSEEDKPWVYNSYDLQQAQETFKALQEQGETEAAEAK